MIFIIYFARGHGRPCTSAIRWCKGTLITEIRRGVVESLILGIRYEFPFRHHLSTSCSSVFSWCTPSIVIISGMRKRVRACASELLICLNSSSDIHVVWCCRLLGSASAFVTPRYLSKKWTWRPRVVLSFRDIMHSSAVPPEASSPQCTLIHTSISATLLQRRAT